MAVKSKLQQAGDGTAIPAGFVGEIKESIGSNNVNKTSSSGANVIFDSAGAPTVTLGIGRWKLEGHAGLQSVSAADQRLLKFYNNTDATAFGGGAIGFINDTTTYLPCSCSGFIDIASGSKVIYLYGVRNGSSSLKIGTDAANISCGYIIATRIA